MRLDDDDDADDDDDSDGDEEVPFRDWNHIFVFSIGWKSFAKLMKKPDWLLTCELLSPSEKYNRSQDRFQFGFVTVATKTVSTVLQLLKEMRNAFKLPSLLVAR